MNYGEFLQIVVRKLQEEVEPGIRVMQRETEKNNGVVYKGILFCQSDINISPTIYMEEFYKSYCKGEDIQKIVSELLEIYDKVRFHESWEDIRLVQYEWVKDKIVMRLVNLKYNEEQLKKVPYVPYLDLAVVFYVLLDASTCGTVSMMIQKEHLSMWGITTKELYDVAKKNTPILLPEYFREISSLVGESTGKICPSIKNAMFVLSNKIQNHGACAILYPGCLERIGELLGEDYYLLPSSIHEMLIVPKQFAIHERDFCEMIRQVNIVQLKPDEILSDHPYYFDHKEKRLRI